MYVCNTLYIKSHQNAYNKVMLREIHYVSQDEPVVAHHFQVFDKLRLSQV